MSSKGYQVKDDKGKTYSFMFHDRNKAQALLKGKSVSLRNQVEEASDMAINPKTVNKTKPMLMKYAKKFGVDLEFGIGGRMPSVLQIKSKSSQAEKGFLDAVGKDKKLMKLLDNVENEAVSPAQQLQSQSLRKRKVRNLRTNQSWTPTDKCGNKDKSMHLNRNCLNRTYMRLQYLEKNSKRLKRVIPFQ